MAAPDSPLIDRPRGVTCAMMDLFKRDAASREGLLNGLGLGQRPHTTRRDSGRDENMGISHTHNFADFSQLKGKSLAQFGLISI
jgi:hypothetical protein